MIRIGTKLRELARRHGLSDAEVARQLGIDPRRYGHYISGVNSPNFKVLVDICRVLQTTPNEVLGFGHKPETKESALTNRAAAILSSLNENQLELAVKLLGCLTQHNNAERGKKRPRK